MVTLNGHIIAIVEMGVCLLVFLLHKSLARLAPGPRDLSYDYILGVSSIYQGSLLYTMWVFLHTSWVSTYLALSVSRLCGHYHVWDLQQ